MDGIKVSVIVPVYNVERYIRRCAESLFRQDLQSVEWLFINDSSPDRSISILMEVLECFPHLKNRVKIINHDVNRGLPTARNTGLSFACGEYIFHCDSDDYVDPGMLSELLDTAESSHADIVWCDWYLSMKHNERYMSQPSFDKAEDAVRAMLNGRMKFNVWNKLAKRSLYVDNGISFPDGYGMGEDMTMILLFTKAKVVRYIPKAFYHYVQTNENAFSKTYSDKHLQELKHNVDRLDQFFHEKFGNLYDKELAVAKLEAKYPFLLSGDRERMELWNNWYPEANVYVWDKSFSLHRRIPQWLAARGYLRAVSFYSFLLNHFFYGVIYR